MNLEIVSVKGSNFLSLGSVQVDFQDRGFVIVEGINNNQVDGAKSNGSGKSSLFELVIWTLTGETVRGTKNVVNDRTDNGACGEIEFKVDGTDYKVIRFKEDRNYGTNLKLYVNGEDVSGKGIRDTEKILQQYLPDLTAQLLGSVIILGQGLPQRFTNNTPAGRKEILEQLSKSDFMIEDIKEKLSLRKSTLNTEKMGIERDITVLETQNNSNLAIISSRNEYLSSNQLTSSNISDIMYIEQQEIDRLTLDLEKVNNELKVLSDDSGEVQGLELEKYQNELVKISGECSVKEYRLLQLDKSISDANNIQTVCPTCGRALDGVHKIDTTPMLTEKATVQEELNTLNEQKREINQKIQQIRSVVDERKRQITSKQNEVNTINRNIQQHEQKRDAIQREYEQQQAKIAVWKEDIKKAQESIEKNNIEIISKKDNLEKLTQRLDAVQKLISMASREFRGYLLDGVVNYIDSRAKHYSKYLFNSATLDFKADGNQIWIGFDGKQYESLSGGERQKVDLIIQFSLREMLMELLGFSCNILVLDEVFDNLDELGCENLINLITTELKDIQSVFIITHHNDIQVPYDDKITIVKDGFGVSTIQ